MALSANTLLAVSMAAAKAAANELQIPLYRYLGGAGAMKLHWMKIAFQKLVNIH